MHELFNNLKEQSKNITVLYAEDDDYVRNSTSLMLKMSFKDVIEAVDGREGLEKYKEFGNRIGLVITDINMPNMCGIEMTSKIKEINPLQQVLVVSAYGEKEYFTKMINLGVDGYLLKPVLPEKFLEVLVASIEKIKLQEQILLERSKMAALGEMLESIVHQWRQPLSVIASEASSIRIQKELGALNDNAFIDSVNSIISSTKHLSQTISDFRDYFKTDKEKRLFKVKEPLQKTLNLLESKFKEIEIELIEEIDDVNVVGFYNELIQVFMNIINNAMDVIMELKEAERRLIFIKIYKKDETAVVKIKDNAGGIPEDIIDRVFDSHFTTKEHKEGTGIGLYMSKQIISEHFNGKIEVQNSEYEYEGARYKGAEFRLEIPLS